jgi:5-methylcytosine-specific restriction endonuclease McrA
LLSPKSAENERQMWVVTRIAVLTYYFYNCVYCGDQAREIDHIVPQSKGGSDEVKNLVACCHKCNCTKNATMLPDEVLRSVKGIAWVSELAIKELMQHMICSELRARNRRYWAKDWNKPFLHPVKS